MKSKNIKKSLELAVPEGHHVEPGVVSASGAKFYSQKLKAYISCFKIHVNADAIISFKDSTGFLVPSMNVVKGAVPYLMQSIISCDQTFSVVHDGALDTVQNVL